MVSRRLAVLALLLVPALASAQRRTRGEKTADWDEIEKSSPSGPKISAKDVEGSSAIKIIVNKRKDLKLSDDQMKQFKDLDKKEEDQTKGLFTTLDSLRLAVRRRPGTDPDEERARMTIARQELMRVIGQIRSSYDSTMKLGLPLLDETNRRRRRRWCRRSVRTPRKGCGIS